MAGTLLAESEHELGTARQAVTRQLNAKGTAEAIRGGRRDFRSTGPAVQVQSVLLV